MTRFATPQDKFCTGCCRRNHHCKHNDLAVFGKKREKHLNTDRELGQSDIRLFDLSL